MDSHSVDEAQAPLLENPDTENAISPEKESLDAIDAALNEESSPESSSESSSSSESESESDDGEDQSDGEEDDIVNPKEDSEIPYTKNEVTEIQIPKVPDGFEINESTKIEFAGFIFNVANCSVIVQANTSGEQQILDEGAVFCLEDRTIIGPLYETFGPIERPFYVIRFEKGSELSAFKRDQKVFYVETSAKFVPTDELKVKGSDASNLHDEEVAPEEQDYSDDEEEAAAKSSKRRKRAKKKNPKKLCQPEPETLSSAPTPNVHAAAPASNMQGRSLQEMQAMQMQMNMQAQMSQWYQYQQYAMFQQGFGNMQQQFAVQPSFPNMMPHYDQNAAMPMQPQVPQQSQPQQQLQNHNNGPKDSSEYNREHQWPSGPPNY